MESETSIEYLPLVDCTSDGKISYGIVQPGSHLESGVPIVRVNNFNDGKLDLSSSIKVHPDIEVKHRRTRLVGGEVLLSLVGSTGQSAIAGPELAGWNVARAVAVIRPSKEYSATWIHICLQTPEVKHFLDSHANTTVQKTLNLKDVCELPILRVPPERRQFIETCWTAFSDKIELNRRMNGTLEGMAQALFKSWFVDFDPVIDNAVAAGNPIPEELADRAEVRRAALADGTANREAAKPFPAAFQQTKELEWIPEGWEELPLKDVCRVLNGRAYENSEFKTDGVPIVRIQNLSGKGKTVYSDLDLPADKLIESDDLIFAWSATFGPHIWRGPKSIYHYHIWKIDVDCSKMNKFVLYCVLGQKTAGMKDSATGSIFTHLTKRMMEKLKVIAPPQSLLPLLDAQFDPAFAAISANVAESETLTNLRDTLLPKLISGELRIPDAEKLAEAALA